MSAGTLARIADAAGEAAARALAAKYGGRRIYIPARLPADHQLCRLIGFDAACALRRALGPGHLDIPLGGRAPSAVGAAVQRMTADGLSAAEIARRLNVSTRTVHYHRASG